MKVNAKHFSARAELTGTHQIDHAQSEKKGKFEIFQIFENSPLVLKFSVFHLWVLGVFVALKPFQRKKFPKWHKLLYVCSNC